MVMFMMEEMKTKMIKVFTINYLIFSIDDEQVDDSHERSIFVRNVDFKATPEELKDHFKECGAINQVTLLTDKVTSNLKGNIIINNLFIRMAYMSLQQEKSRAS